MRRFIILFILFQISQITKAQSDYLKFPDYDKVVTKFFETYSIKDRPNDVSVTNEIKFEKQPTGWHISVISYNPHEHIVKQALFWERKSQTYLDINFEKLVNKDENKENLKVYLGLWYKKYFRICPYYGYPSWDWDVIQEFKDAENLPDSTLYALGRAYSSYAQNLIDKDIYFPDPNKNFNLPQGKNSMNKEQLIEYRYYQHLAIATFEKVNKLNPNYETIVGAIGVKLADEYLYTFLNLRIYQNEEEAKKEIVPGLYNDFFISIAKNYLNSCDSNAILFTNGDNDTYPLLYVQSEYGFRTDVMVVNLSLLNNERYINSLREPILDAAGLPISLTAEEISGNNRSQIVVYKKEDKPLTLTMLMQCVRDDKHSLIYDSTKYYYIPTNKLRFNENLDTMDWELDKNKGYLLRNQLMVYDLMEKNNWARPLNFATSMEDENFFGLDDYLQLEGFAFRVTSKKKDTLETERGKVNSSIMYTNLMAKFDWKGIDSLNKFEKSFCCNIRNYFSRLADELIKENKNDSARKVIEKYIELLPDKSMYFDVYMIPFIECYYKMYDFENGNKIAKKLISNINRNLDNSNDGDIYIISDYAKAKEVKLIYLKELALKYRQMEIVELLKSTK